MRKTFIFISLFISSAMWAQSLPLDSAQQAWLDSISRQFELQEVEVRSKRPLLERQIDKLIINVSQSPLAAGNNGSDILKRAPGIMIDKDGNITVNGKGVEVYVDGRPSYLSGQQLKAMLDGTDGNTIDKIEILSNPSAKYDASGTGGIINIKLKKNKSQGLNGTLSATYGGMYYGDISRYLQNDMVSFNLNYRGEKTYTFAQLNQVYTDVAQQLTTEVRTPLMERSTNTTYQGDFQYYMLKLGNDWLIDSVNTLGFIWQTPIMKSDFNGFSSDSTQTDMGNFSNQHTANLNFTHIFDNNLSRELTVNVDYNRYNMAETNNQQRPLLGLDIRTRQVANIYSAKVDFQTMFWQTGMIECGVKYALSTTDNNMNTDSVQPSTAPISDLTRFRYAEHVAAAYITVGKQFGQHWNAKLGLRGEYTYSEGDWISTDSVTRRSYFNPFPTAFVGYASSPLGKWQQPVSASLSYTRRIKRPSYYQLNPFTTYVDAHSYSKGNTALMPEFNNDVEVNFAYSQHVSLTFNFSHTQDMQKWQLQIQPNGDGIMTWQNFGTCTTHGGSLSLTELPIVPKFDDQHKVAGAWLALTLNAGYFHFINKSYARNGDGTPQYDNRNHYWRLNGSLNAYLPQNWILSADGWYSAPMTIGYEYMHATYGMSAGVRKIFPKIGLILNLQLRDALRSGDYVSETQGLPAGEYSGMKSKNYQQAVVLSVIYNFGKQQWVKRRKVGDMEESSRLGGGSGR
ncbi:MAG: TonB-dependent receptor [Paludibacteraceae bacterium]|nr:TonB-dependent receptor [Paludibacteraceae bacterium]